MQERFWAKVEKGPECWEWQAGKFKTGYGSFSIDGKCYRAHRVAYEIMLGPIPSGTVVRHTCDNRACVAPHHLELGSQADNISDMVSRGRSKIGQYNRDKTHCKMGHEYVLENMYTYKLGRRICKVCTRQQARDRYHERVKKSKESSD